jgi:protein-S-isoprenylcysteine O-methyltransferase Ste14
MQMTATYLSTFLSEAIVVWLAMLSSGVVAYLFYLQIKEMRRNRRMDAIRQRLGLRRA